MLFLLTAGTSFGQLPITIQPFNDPVCLGNSVSLIAVVTSTDYGTDSYTFQVIPYAPMDTTKGKALDSTLTHCSSTSGGKDDCWGGPYDIGFNFCFFSQLYSKFFVGSNGWIGFRSPGSNPWNTFVARIIPDNDADSAAPKDCIFAPWQDWLPTLSGIQNIYYYTTGTAPDRQLVVYWKNCPMYGCSTTKGSFQIVLKEQGGVIENHLQNKPNCPQNGNNATQGVHNNDGTIAFTAVVNGIDRNKTSWSALEESMRFVPDGVSWHSGSPAGPVLGYGDTVTFSPTATTWAYAVINTCLGVIHYDSALVHVIPTLTGPLSLCKGTSGATYVTETGMTDYSWTVSAGGTVTSGGTSTDNTIAVTWNGAGNQTVGVLFTDPSAGCTSTIYRTVNVNVINTPVPTLTGTQSLCIHSTGNVYNTVPGKSGYLWTVTGGTITAGGGPADAACTVTWNTAGTQTISVLFTDPVTLCTALAPTVLNVTVNPLPTPTIVSGVTLACDEVPGKVYETQSGMANYVWTISGGSITGGGGSSSASATVTWTVPGTQTISINYYDPVTQCTASAPTAFPVQVIPLPQPVIAGPSMICLNSPQGTYTTQPAMNEYAWAITPASAGTILSGSGTNSIVIQWNSGGNHMVEVACTDVNGCSAAAPAQKNVTVINIVPALSGTQSLCVNSTGNVYNTQTGKTGYIWTVTGGIKTAGGGSSDATCTVTWTTTGAQSVSVNFTDPVTLCTAVVPTVQNITVNPLPAPSFLSGESLVCAGVPGKTYETQPGMTNYTWSITGGTITGGGSSASSTATVTWTDPGNRTIGINYHIPVTQCTAAAPTILPVQVIALPVPSVAGTSAVCLNTPQGTYTTQTAMNNYTWAITPASAGTILSGSGTSSIQVQWNSPGSHLVTVRYADAYGCYVAAPAQQTVVVTPVPVTTIVAAAGVICSRLSYLYKTPPDPACTFTWAITPAGLGNITSGQGTSEINVTWLTQGDATIRVTGSNNSYPCTSVSSVPVPVKPSPFPGFAACFDLKTTLNARKITLRGATPFIAGQGVYNGAGVSNPSPGVFEFNPLAAGSGTHHITYTYTNNYGCSITTAPVSILVKSGNFTCGNSLTDVRDEKTYPTEMFSGKCWMTKNLDYGVKLAENTAPQTDNCLTEKFCSPVDVNCTNFGGFYQWDEIMQYAGAAGSKGICPPEWHLPTQAEWQSLIDNLMPGIVAPDANGLAGSGLKDLAAVVGFHGLLGGLNFLDNTWVFTSQPLAGTMFWTSTSSGADEAIAHGLNQNNPSVSTYSNSRSNAFPVRCVKD
jgi:uncharacterized protein (TIGR02145 family)